MSFSLLRSYRRAERGSGGAQMQTKPHATNVSHSLALGGAGVSAGVSCGGCPAHVPVVVIVATAPFASLVVVFVVFVAPLLIPFV